MQERKNEEKKPAPQTEEKIISDFTRHSQNTHKQAVSCSIGMALLTIAKNYLGEPRDEKIMQQLIKECLDDLGKINSTDTIHIINSTKEALHLQWDIVSLYLPKANSSTEYEDRKIAFPLIEVLALTWKAINDDSKYTHHFQGDEKERLEAAKKDRPNRQQSFLSFLKEIRTGQKCHQGNRNDIGFTLQGYESIEIMEDERAFALAFLKEEIFKKYTEANKTKNTQAALFEWMENANASELLKMIDPDHSITKNLKARFIQHGFNPEQKHITQTIADAPSYLEFSCDPKDFLYKLNQILNIFDNTPKAIETVKKWIKSDDFDLDREDDRKKANRFWFIYNTYQTLLRHEILLTITGNLPDQVIHLKKFCETYLNECDEKPFYPVIAKEVVDTATKLHETIKMCEKENLIPFIKDFLAQWSIAEEEKNVATKRRLFISLYEPEIREKIIVTDSDLKKLFSESKVTPGEISITPYLINRLFLTAILIDPQQWSSTFTDKFRETLEFVKNNFNAPKSGIARALSRGSYPHDLLYQLEYQNDRKKWMDLKEGKEPSRAPSKPSRVFLLIPEQCQTLREIYQLPISLQTDPELWEQFYNTNRIKWDQFANDISMRNLTHFVKHIIPTKNRYRIMADILNQARFFTGISWCLNLLPKDDVEKFFEQVNFKKAIFDWGHLANILIEYDTCSDQKPILKMNTTQFLSYLLNRLGGSHIIQLINAAHRPYPDLERNDNDPLRYRDPTINEFFEYLNRKQIPLSTFNDALRNLGVLVITYATYLPIYLPEQISMVLKTLEPKEKNILEKFLTSENTPPTLASLCEILNTAADTVHFDFIKRVNIAALKDLSYSAVYSLLNLFTASQRKEIISTITSNLEKVVEKFVAREASHTTFPLLKTEHKQESKNTDSLQEITQAKTQVQELEKQLKYFQKAPGVFIYSYRQFLLDIKKLLPGQRKADILEDTYLVDTATTPEESSTLENKLHSTTSLTDQYKRNLNDLSHLTSQLGKIILQANQAMLNKEANMEAYDHLITLCLKSYLILREYDSTAELPQLFVEEIQSDSYYMTYSIFSEDKVIEKNGKHEKQKKFDASIKNHLFLGHKIKDFLNFLIKHEFMKNEKNPYFDVFKKIINEKLAAEENPEHFNYHVRLLNIFKIIQDESEKISKLIDSSITYILDPKIKDYNELLCNFSETLRKHLATQTAFSLRKKLF